MWMCLDYGTAQVPGTPCARPNATAVGESVCIGWLWKNDPASPGSFTSAAGQLYRFDARGTVTWWDSEVEMRMSGWPTAEKISDGTGKPIIISTLAIELIKLRLPRKCGLDWDLTHLPIRDGKWLVQHAYRLE